MLFPAAKSPCFVNDVSEKQSLFFLPIIITFASLQKNAQVAKLVDALL